jgi:O-antigen/teichoic acid export membrane protein
MTHRYDQNPLGGPHRRPNAMIAESTPSQTNTPPPTARSTFRSDLIANFAGQGWAALMQLLFIPLYVRFLGIEGYGLVGFYAVLLAFGRVLDFGLIPTITRELARKSALPDSASECRDLVKTLQAIYWTIGLSIGAIVVLLAWIITSSWIGPSSLPADTVHSAVVAMGIFFAIQWPLAFYQGALMGLQRQVLMNAVRIPLTTLSSGGAVLILWLVSPTVMAFFGWQILLNVLHVGILAAIVWRSLPLASHTPQFRFSIVRELWRFAAGTSAIMATGIVLTQADKLVVSKFLSLTDFGYYSIASTAAAGLFLFILPVYNTLYPRFSSLVALKDESGLRLQYRRGLEIMGALLFSTSALLFAFAPEILRIWTRDPLVSENATWSLRFLAAGTALNGVMFIPFALQLALAWTSIGIKMNLMFLVTMTPLWIVMALWYGPAGAASVWLLLNVIQVLVVVPLMHRRVLRGDAPRILLREIAIPLLVAACLFAAVRLAVPEQLPSMILVPLLLSSYGVCLVTLVMVSPATRQWLVSRVRNVRG